jgi:flagellar hook assembly protein FlgD
MSGRKVRTLVDQQVTAGEHFVRWDARNDAGERVASGTYVYRLQAGDLIVSNTMLLLK